MYIVRFVRRDNRADEDYYYHTEQEARKHIELFKDDDSELYSKIELLEWNNDIRLISNYNVA